MTNNIHKQTMSKYLMSKKMCELALSLTPGTARAQAYNIAQKLKELQDGNSIADMMLQDHNSVHHAQRHAALLVEAGLATYEENKISGFYGTYIFIDGSKL